MIFSKVILQKMNVFSVLLKSAGLKDFDVRDVIITRHITLQSIDDINVYAVAIKHPLPPVRYFIGCGNL
jgi:hypothetical protein